MDKVVLSHTALSRFDCPQQFQFSVIQRLRLAIKREPLIIGGLHALGNELGEEAMLEEFDRITPVYSQDDQDKKTMKRAMLLGMHRGYQSAFITPPTAVKEVEWLLPIVNPATGRESRLYRIAGKADKVDLENLVLYEDKTTGETPKDSKLASLFRDRQVNNALSGIQRQFDVQIREVIYRYTRKPSIRQKKDETPQQFADRVLEDYLKEDRRDFYFIEERLLIDQAQVRAWEQDLWHQVHIIHYCYRNNYWPRNSSRCSEWGGCDYAPICNGEDCADLYKIEEPNPELGEEKRSGFTHEEDRAPTEIAGLHPDAVRGAQDREEHVCEQDGRPAVPGIRAGAECDVGVRGGDQAVEGSDGSGDGAREVGKVRDPDLGHGGPGVPDVPGACVRDSRDTAPERPGVREGLAPDDPGVCQATGENEQAGPGSGANLPLGGHRDHDAGQEVHQGGPHAFWQGEGDGPGAVGHHPVRGDGGDGQGSEEDPARGAVGGMGSGGQDGEAPGPSAA